MTENQIGTQRTRVNRDVVLTLSLKSKSNISYQSSLSIPRVKKVHLSHRHRSLQIQVRSFLQANSRL
jgi:hypothetical protein